MKTVTVGLPEREAFAVSLLMRKLRPDWSFESQPVEADHVAGDLIVLDADAWQGRHGAQSDSTRLRALLHEKPAVLLTAPVPPRPEAVAEADAAARDWQASGWIVLRRPYPAAAMREALSRAEQRAVALHTQLPVLPHADLAAKHLDQAAGRQPFSASVASVSGPPSSGLTGRTTQFSSAFFTTTVQGPSDTAPLAGSVGLPPPDITEDTLSVAAFTACVPTSPSPECRHFLGMLADRLAQPGAFEMGFTMINGIVFDAAADWAASNTPMSVVRMVARSRSLGAYVKLTDLDPRIDPRARAAQRGLQPYSLGALLHALARVADCRLLLH